MFELPSPRQFIARGKGDGLRHRALGLDDKTAQIAATDVALHDNSPLNVLTADLRRP